MRKILIVTHGEFGQGLLDVSREYFGADGDFQFIGFDGSLELSVLNDQIIEYICSNEFDELLCLVDIRGGTPYNIASRIAVDNKKVKVISGINLAMILQLIVNKNSNITEIIEAARESIGG